MHTLVVSSRKSCDALRSMLNGCGCGSLRFAFSAGEARQQIGQFPFELILINAPLPDEFGRELALSCIDRTQAGVVMLVPAAQADKIAAGAEELGIFVLSKPVSPTTFCQSVRLIQSCRRQLQKLEEQNRKLLQKLDDMRIVSRAKCALVRGGQMTEDEAHHLIERRAMNLRITRREAAMEILKQYHE